MISVKRESCCIWWWDRDDRYFLSATIACLDYHKQMQRSSPSPTHFFSYQLSQTFTPMLLDPLAALAERGQIDWSNKQRIDFNRSCWKQWRVLLDTHNSAVQTMHMLIYRKPYRCPFVLFWETDGDGSASFRLLEMTMTRPATSSA